MVRETIVTCGTCGSLCRSIECDRTNGNAHSYYRPMVEGTLTKEETRAQMLETIQQSKFNRMRLEAAITTLSHVEQFLASKGHKFMHMEVKRTLMQLQDRRGA